jgi:type I restriction enzyme M protein
LPASDLISSIISTKRKITELGLKNSSAKILPKNSVLVSTRATIGRIAINKIECSTNQGFKNIIINDFNKVNTYFVALMMTKLIDKMNSMATGGTFKELSTTSFRTLEIPLPPLSIQEEIVAEIEGYQKIIDGAKMVVENYQPKIDIDPEWEIVELGKHCKIKGGNAFKSEDYVDNGVQLIRMGNVKQMFFDFENSPSYLPISYLNTNPNYILVKGDLLISMTGTVGKEDYGNVCQIDVDEKFLLNQRVGKFEIYSEFLNREFLYYFANSDNFRKQLFSNTSGGVRQANISNKGIESILIPLPTIEIQQFIVDQLKKEQELVNTNKQLIEIFEQKIKDRIGKVWGASTTLSTGSSDMGSASEYVLDSSAERSRSMAAEPKGEYLKH